MKRIRLLLATAAVLLGVGGLVPTMAVAATPQSTICDTLGSSSDCSQDPPNSVSLNSVIKALINILSFVIGVTAVIMIMVGGFRYITANGDSGHITSAKNTIIYSVVGLVVVAMAQFIVKYVLARLK